MKIKTLGFEWSLECEKLSANDFFEVLSKVSEDQVGKMKKFLSDESDGSSDSFMVIAKKDTLWVGAMVKVRDIRALMKLVKEGDGMQLKSHQLQDEEAAVEVNFFIFNPETCRGLYQYYHQSTWLDTFCSRCKRLYDGEVARMRKEVDGAYEDSEWTIKRYKLESAPYVRKSLKYNILATELGLHELVRSLKRVKAVEVVTVTDSFKADSDLTPVSPLADRILHRFTFKDDVDSVNATKLGQIADFLKTVDGKFKKVRIEGMTPGDNEVVYKLEENYHSFADMDYDSAVGDILIDLTNPEGSLVGSRMIDVLIEISKANKDTFYGA